MSIDRRHLQQHLEQMAQAYGADLTLPAGAASARRAAPECAAPDPPPAAAPIRAEFAARGTAPTADAPPAATSQPATSQAAITPAAPPPQDEREARLQALRDEVTPCTRCKLHRGRQNTVFGEGNTRARVLFIGEAPGSNEDRTGRPFVGAAGQLLDRILDGAMGLRRSDVYIANINKCRPPDNRVPDAEEVAACLPFLRQQVEILCPEVIVCLGRTAAQNLLGTTQSTTALRGQTLDYCGVPVIVTWHPAYLLREPSHKRETWEDIKRVNRLLGLPDVPPRAS